MSSITITDGHFNIGDLDYLTETLSPAITVWHELGLQLGVPSTELDNIHGSWDTRGEPKACLREMLKVWLQMASPHAGELSALVSALRKDSVGKSQLAAELEQRHCTQHTPAENHKGSQAKECIDPCE